MDLNLLRSDDPDARVLEVIAEIASWHPTDPMGFPDDPAEFCSDLWKANFFDVMKARKARPSPQQQEMK
jgi:hypothetical protein